MKQKRRKKKNERHFNIHFSNDSSWFRFDSDSRRKFTIRFFIRASITKRARNQCLPTLCNALCRIVEYFPFFARIHSSFFFSFFFRKSSLLYFIQWASPIMVFLRFSIGKFVSSRVNLATEDWDLIWFAGDWPPVKVE